MQMVSSTQIKVADAALQKGLAAAAGKHGNDIKKAGNADTRRGGRGGGGGKENMPGVLGVLEEEMGDTGRQDLQEAYQEQAGYIVSENKARICSVKPGPQQLHNAYVGPRTRLGRSKASSMR
jgi:hypothetical protein